MIQKDYKRCNNQSIFMNTYQQNNRAKTNQNKHRTVSNFALSFHPERDGDSLITSRYAPDIIKSRSGSKNSKHKSQRRRRQKNFSTIGQPGMLDQLNLASHNISGELKEHSI